MRRRLLAGVAAAGLGLLLAAPGAQAAPADWAGSEVATKSASTSPFTVEALTHRRFTTGYQLVVRLFATPPAGLPAGCGPADRVELSPVTTGKHPSIPDTASSTASITAPCNGTYVVDVEAQLRGPLGSRENHPYSGEVRVAVPPPEIQNIQYGQNAEGVVFTWDRSASNAPDFLGYQVQRKDGADWTTLCEGDTDLALCADQSPPAEGGDVVYRVRGRRAAPGSPVYSTGGTVTVPVTPRVTTTVPGATDGGTDGGGADGGAAGGTAGTDGGTGTTIAGGGVGKPAPRGGRTFQPLERGKVGIGTKAPRLGAANGNYPDLLLSDDGDYSTDLPYGDLAGGEGDGEGVSSFYYESIEGKGMAVPVATGFVLAAWAFHLRYLAKASKPVKAPGGSRGRGPRHGPGRR